MRLFITACLVSAAVAAPSKLGGAGHHDHGQHGHARQGRQGGYIAPREELSGYGDSAASAIDVRTAPIAAPIGIRSFDFDAPNPEFRYSFETENDIKQEAEGTMKNIDGTDVVVMKGSYSYVGVDGQTWTVEWFADETGDHPSAPFLPKSVEPIHPEVKAAVEAQLRFAAEEAAAAAASSRSETYAAPESFYGAAASSDSYDAPLTGYGGF